MLCLRKLRVAVGVSSQLEVQEECLGGRASAPGEAMAASFGLEAFADQSRSRGQWSEELRYDGEGRGGDERFR